MECILKSSFVWHFFLGAFKLIVLVLFFRETGLGAFLGLGCFTIKRGPWNSVWRSLQQYLSMLIIQINFQLLAHLFSKFLKIAVIATLSPMVSVVLLINISISQYFQVLVMMEMMPTRTVLYLTVFLWFLGFLMLDTTRLIILEDLGKLVLVCLSNLRNILFLYDTIVLGI